MVASLRHSASQQRVPTSPATSTAARQPEGAPEGLLGAGQRNSQIVLMDAVTDVARTHEQSARAIDSAPADGIRQRGITTGRAVTSARHLLFLYAGLQPQTVASPATSSFYGSEGKGDPGVCTTTTTTTSNYCCCPNTSPFDCSAGVDIALPAAALTPASSLAATAYQRAESNPNTVIASDFVALHEYVLAGFSDSATVSAPGTLAAAGATAAATLTGGNGGRTGGHCAVESSLPAGSAEDAAAAAATAGYDDGTESYGGGSGATAGAAAAMHPADPTGLADLADLALADELGLVFHDNCPPGGDGDGGHDRDDDFLLLRVAASVASSCNGGAATCHQSPAAGVAAAAACHPPQPRALGAPMPWRRPDGGNAAAAAATTVASGELGLQRYPPRSSSAGSTGSNCSVLGEARRSSIPGCSAPLEPPCTAFPLHETQWQEKQKQKQSAQLAQGRSLLGWGVRSEAGVACPPRCLPCQDGLLFLSPAAPQSLLLPGPWDMDRYSIVRQLYQGYASHVYKAVCPRSEAECVLKAYNMSGLSPFLTNQVVRELDIHSRIHHPSIVQLFAAFKEGDVLVLVQEYVRGGSLDRVRRKLGGRMTEFQAMHLVLLPLLNALVYLHGRGIVHRDIKPENVLLTEEWELKLCDFGVSICLHEERAVTKTGSKEYMAPEVMVCPLKRGADDNKHNEQLAYTPAVDVWSVGALMYELLVGFTPFPAGPPKALGVVGPGSAAAASATQLSFPASVGEGARALIRDCLQLEPVDRPTVHQLLQHPWVHEALEAAAAAELEGAFL